MRRSHPAIGLAAAMVAALFAARGAYGAAPSAGLREAGVTRGVCAVLGLPAGTDAAWVVQLAQDHEGLIVYFQSPEAGQVAAVRRRAEAAGLLGSRVVADVGSWRSIHLADNIADAVLAGPEAASRADRDELLRVLHPRAKAVLGEETLVKPAPQGADAWSHVYHGPDNNTQSADQLARAPYLTQFLAEPLFVPMPEVTVAAGGRVFRAFGHIAHKANQNAMLNTLICVDGYNGVILWKRPLKEGFMIHRCTMIATSDTLYLGDDESCKLIDAATGRVRDEIVVPAGAADGPVWKWMALVDGVLYALVGHEEVRPATQRSGTPGLGHWPWGMWEGHDYKDPKTNFAWGRTFLAIDPETKRVLWRRRLDDYVDGRAVCLSEGRLYYYCPDKQLGCLNTADGEPVWATSDSKLLAAIGPNQRAQQYVTGYATTSYLKCRGEYLFFAGPQRERLVVVSTRDGRLLWTKDNGNRLLVLRDDGVYAAGPQLGPPELSCIFAYETGEVIAQLPMRRACTRATGSVDSVFYRASGGTIRFDTATRRVRHLAPMRPPCQDGVVISEGHLYWGPWMCGCQLSLYGHIALGPAGDFDFHPPLGASRLQTQPGADRVEPLEAAPGDWPAYGGDNRRSGRTAAPLPARAARAWAYRTPAGARPTAPITGGGLVFFGDRSGAVTALEADTGKVRWRTYLSGPVFLPPALSQGRLHVGCADGRVYALEAASGRELWRFQAAPADQRIMVYGSLMSRWPVAGGVVVDKGVVYAAAGIAHYDGCYVYALDAATGRPLWKNDRSGELSAVGNGISLQGPLYLEDGELRFLGGGAYETARYDTRTGKCLNEPNNQPVSRHQTAFYPYFPEYGKYMSLDCTLPDGRSLVYDASYEGSRHSRLALLPAGAPKPPKEASRWYTLSRRRAAPEAKPIWRDKAPRVFGAFLIGEKLLVGVGEEAPLGAGPPMIAAIRIDDGRTLWQERLPACVVKGGAATDRAGRILVALENGQLLCYQ